MTGMALHVVEGPDAPRTVLLSGAVEVGRDHRLAVPLTDRLVSERHLRATPNVNGVVVEDLQSTNGTFVNDTRIGGPTIVGPGDMIRVGTTTLRVSTSDAPPRVSPSPAPGDLTDELLAMDTWTDQAVADAGIPIVDASFVTVGGGIGSFVFVDYLRIAGVAPESIKVLTLLDYPWQTYEYLTGVSQIPPGERLRSDSSSMPDNIWGFPSYAFREAWEAKGVERIAPIWNVLTEYILTDYWTPTSRQVFRSMQAEADRIGYWPTVAKGNVRVVRKRDGGGYFSVLTPPEGTSATRRIAYRSTTVHIAVGYPGLRFLPDLQEYKHKHGADRRMVNAYEPHEHIYNELNRRREGTVMVRGGGIVASRILQRLIDDRDKHGTKTEIIHLFRTYVQGSHGPSIFMRRKGGDGFAYQGFNWPKATWGGQFKAKMRKLEGEDRARLLKLMGGTNTPRRKLWQEQLARARREGFYKAVVGEVSEVLPGPGQTIVTRVEGSGQTFDLAADFIVDATGLEADITEHRLVADLLQHSGAGRNPIGRLDVERTFEVRGCRSGAGRMYAAGAITLGGYYAGVDSFLGLQYAALEACDDLADLGYCHRIGMARSIGEWWRWALRRPPSP